MQGVIVDIVSGYVICFRCKHRWSFIVREHSITTFMLIIAIAWLLIIIILWLIYPHLVLIYYYLNVQWKKININNNNNNKNNNNSKTLEAKGC